MMLVANQTRKGDCMMKSIVEEKLVSFKTLEQKVFAYVCELGRMITQIILENYDDELAKERDKKAYRDKGKRETSIKTVYGEVEYSGEFIGQSLRMEKRLIFICWIRRCRWKRSG